MITRGEVVYRKRFKEYARADRFARLVSGNVTRFTRVRLCRTQNLGFTVEWRPLNPAHERRRQQERRRDTRDEEGNLYSVTRAGDCWRVFNPLSGQDYFVSRDGVTCTCPDFTRRCAGTGVVCKHVLEVRRRVTHWLLEEVTA